jgi:hypothetical protein
MHSQSEIGNEQKNKHTAKGITINDINSSSELTELQL